ncbi:cystathionine gamma-synthase [Penicillium freii]|uniref:Cystathionine gamma-synthase n=1 Tax=Penicillium freii TaxID=48697 RepID=A0A101ML28_PENFR|nr:cystathionine gamma-synthase [Penicillium freii]KUM62534.1 hypothetical protein ACN42_g4584 [Penicillium freii]
MTIQVTLPLGTPVPSRNHAVSVQLPKWKDMVGLGNADAQTLNALKNGYPRSILHVDVQTLVQRCKLKFLSPGKFDISLFPDRASAEACESYITSTVIHDDEVVPLKSLDRFIIRFNGCLEPDCHCHHSELAPLWAVVYPESVTTFAASFWRLTGTGISSRLAQTYLLHVEFASRVELSEDIFGLAQSPGEPVYHTLRQRIANLLERATILPHRAVRVTPSDVFLFPSGMSAIYHVHHMLLQWRGSESVMVGFPYELTLKMLETYGPSCKFFSAGSSKDLDTLEQYLSHPPSNGTKKPKLQAIWCECPSNPLLYTPDLQRIRRIADRNNLAVIADDTIGSFANVDLLDIADVVVTSLTKSFNGFADVLAGSATLNPNSHFYSELKALLTAIYTNTLYIEDAMQLEINSRSFMKRAAIMNETAEYLVDHLRLLVPEHSRSNPCAASVSSAGDDIVSAVYYPKGSPSMSHYTQQMRQPTDDFHPGYGCLFTIEFETVEAAATFFDHLDLHKGPSLGANVTLAQPYVQMVLQRQKDWAASHGLKETIVRISVGLEDKKELLGRLQHALSMASKSQKGLAMTQIT